MTSHPHNETRPVYRLSQSVPGDEPVKEPIAFPAWLYDKTANRQIGVIAIH